MRATDKNFSTNFQQMQEKYQLDKYLSINKIDNIDKNLHLEGGMHGVPVTEGVIQIFTTTNKIHEE